MLAQFFSPLLWLLTSTRRFCICNEIYSPFGIIKCHEHLNYFNERSLEVLLRANGFDAVACTTADIHPHSSLNIKVLRRLHDHAATDHLWHSGGWEGQHAPGPGSVAWPRSWGVEVTYRGAVLPKNMPLLSSAGRVKTLAFRRRL